jgi:sugar lactone lactonase YvrE
MCFLQISPTTKSSAGTRKRANSVYFSDKAGRANGMYFDKKGNLVACSDEDNQVWSFDKNGKPTILVKRL